MVFLKVVGCVRTSLSGRYFGLKFNLLWVNLLS